MWYLSRSTEVKLELMRESINVVGKSGNLVIHLPPREVKNIKLDVYKIKTKVYLLKLIKLVLNFIRGLNAGFFKELELEGLGYNFLCYPGKRVIKFEGGYSHSIYMLFGRSNVVLAEKKRLLIYGLSKKTVSNLSSSIKSIKKVEKYKGKGIRELGSSIVLKVGKKR